MPESGTTRKGGEILSAAEGRQALFQTPPLAEPRRGLLLVVGLGLLVVVGVVLAIVLRHPGEGARSGQTKVQTMLPVDPYAANLQFAQLAMSQSTSLSGGTSTFIDGHLKNNGNRTLTSVTVQVFFANDEGLSPQMETLPLALIRTHEPYVDTEPVSAAPLKPGDDPEFRLIFETLPENWNQQMPEIHVVKITAR